MEDQQNRHTHCRLHDLYGSRSVARNPSTPGIHGSYEHRFRNAATQPANLVHGNNVPFTRYLERLHLPHSLGLWNGGDDVSSDDSRSLHV